MRQLGQGDRGTAVRRWQLFLVGQGLQPGPVDGDFGPLTVGATEAFQKRHGLPATGEVDNRTAGQAALLGFKLLTGEVGTDVPLPDFRSPTAAWRKATFGAFSYRHEPTADNPEHIRITGNWQSENIVEVDLPQLGRIARPVRRAKTQFNRKAANQLVALWQAWEEADLLDRVLTWDGGFVPRFQRGSTTSLSNHAYGTAFDINANWNRYGAIPAARGEEGSVVELVPLAHQHGFYWGGHYRSRPDGMHFEVGRI